MSRTVTVPYRLTVNQVETALEQLGISAQWLVRMQLDHRSSIRVEHARHDGKRVYAAGDKVAIVAHDIEIGCPTKAERRASARGRLRTARRSIRFAA